MQVVVYVKCKTITTFYQLTNSLYIAHTTHTHTYTHTFLTT